MNCTTCGAATMVIDSRNSADGYAQRRRRGCPVCNQRFTTVELREEDAAALIAVGDAYEETRAILAGVVEVVERAKSDGYERLRGRILLPPQHPVECFRTVAERKGLAQPAPKEVEP